MGGASLEDATPLGLSLGDCKTLVEADTEATAEAGDTIAAEAATAGVLVFVIAAAAGTAGTVGTTTN